MSHAITCPTAAELRQLMLGELPGADAIEQHLLECPHCLEQARALQLPKDRLLESLARPGDTLLAAEKTVVDGLIERLQSLAATTTISTPGEQRGGDVVEHVQRLLAPPQEGDELGRLGGYRILSVLGSGGMGLVFEAEDVQLRRRVAVKLMRPELAASKSARERFLREACAMAAIKHSHIATIHHVGEEAGIPYFAMELLDGESLQQRLNREGRLPMAEALQIGRDIAAGLAAAHERGLIHRDIKPSNLWLEPAGDRTHVKILDFGLAWSDSGDKHLTETGLVLGTPAFMSPEQARGEMVDARSDLFSLGCILYQACTGSLPFARKDRIAALFALAYEQPRAPRELNPETPAPLSDLILHLLAKNPPARPATARETATALAAIAADMPVRSAHRRKIATPLLAVASAAAVLAAIIGLSGIMFQFNTKHGTLTVNVLEPNVKVFIDGEEKLVIDSSKVGRVELVPGPHEMIVRRGDEELFTKRFTLKHGGDLMIDAKWEPKQAAAPAPPQTPPTPLPLGEKGRGEGHAAEARSPLDDLDANSIPADERVAGQPAEVVAVLGTQRWRQWAEVLNLAFSPDGRTVASAGQEASVRLWNVNNGSEHGVVRHPGGAYAVVFSPDGKLLASSGSEAIRIWDAHTGQELTVVRQRGLALAFSPDGKTLAAGGPSGLVCLIDPATGKFLAELRGHFADVQSVAFSPDGKTLVSGSADLNAKSWDLATQMELKTFYGHAHQLYSVAVSPDNRLLASASRDASVRLWDLATGEQKSVLQHGGAVYSLAFAPDGKSLASVGDYTGICTWGVADAKQRRVIGKPESLKKLSTVQFSPDGKSVATAGHDCRITLWDVETGKLMNGEEPNGLIRTVAFAPDGRTLASAGTTDYAVHLWDTATAKERTVLRGHERDILCLAFTPDGKTLASGGTDRTIRLWDPAAEEQRLLIGTDGNVFGVAFSPSGLTLASAGHKGRLWDATDGKQLETWQLPQLRPEDDFTSVAFAPDGKTIAWSGADKAVWLMNVSPWRDRPKLYGPLVPMRRVAFSRDGNRLAAGCEDGSVRIWSVGEQPVELVTWRGGHSSRVTSVAFAADDKSIYSAGQDGRVIHWNSGLNRRVYEMPGPVWGLSLAPDGRHLATANGNGTVYILRVAPP